MSIAGACHPVKILHVVSSALLVLVTRQSMCTCSWLCCWDDISASALLVSESSEHLQDNQTVSAWHTLARCTRILLQATSCCSCFNGGLGLAQHPGARKKEIQKRTNKALFRSKKHKARTSKAWHGIAACCRHQGSTVRPQAWSFAHACIQALHRQANLIQYNHLRKEGRGMDQTECG